MGHAPIKDEDFVIDLENGRTESESLDDQLLSVDDSFVSLSVGPLDNVLKVVIDSKVGVEKEVDFSVKKIGKEKRKKASSAKKPPKPPRPPRGFSLDAADQKLIKELAELAMMKRARIERMKALQAKKALKASSSSSSSSMSGGSLFAMLFTIIFFLMMLLQGMSCRNPGMTTSAGSPQTAQTKENGLVFIQEQLNPSASDSILPHTRSSNLFQKISGSASASRKLL
uniref:uncharacterized protein LOC122579512 n=1 Tax=Erigeron canadensis TaxID=72917 RepID=UPI001CB95DE3|nr:uncharacterized protein LOC122579512 [Erigeron canadensis]